METTLFKFTIRTLAVAAAVLLASCGGGDEPITSVKVVGDSLADSGTFGYKFTIQGGVATGTGSTPIWPEIVASSNRAPAICPAYAFSGTAFTTVANCGNFAIGGGRINYVADPTSPLSIRTQLTALGGMQDAFNSQTLLLIDGGGNDAADLVGAYLKITQDAGASYRDLLLTLLPADTVATLLGGGAEGAAQAGGAYMQALADAFFDAIKTNALNKGAKKVAVLNMPDITLTPRFAMVLQAVAAANGQPAASQVQAVIRQWIGAFNARLASKLSGISEVAIVDFYGTFAAQIASPDTYGLTNVTDPACPAVDTGSDGLPTYDFPTCSGASLSANPPSGASADWWQTYTFSDSFHPTPKAHELMAAEVNKAISAKGWN
jgi:outer membrane lipase/esterase